MGAREGDIGFFLYVEFAFLMYLLELSFFYFFYYPWNADKKFTWRNVVVMLLSRQWAEREGEEEGEEGCGGRIYSFVWV